VRHYALILCDAQAADYASMKAALEDFGWLACRWCANCRETWACCQSGHVQHCCRVDEIDDPEPDWETEPILATDPDARPYVLTPVAKEYLRQIAAQTA
jgi:hypothetical protein